MACSGYIGSMDQRTIILTLLDQICNAVPGRSHRRYPSARGRSGRAPDGPGLYVLCDSLCQRRHPQPPLCDLPPARVGRLEPAWHRAPVGSPEMSAVGHIHAAPLASPRLQLVLQLLSDGRPHTTRDIVRKARVMGVPACVAELRHHGAEITCVRQETLHGPRLYYCMTKAPDLK